MSERKPRVLTLCPQCRALLESAYSVNTYYYDKAATQPEPKCQNCKKARADMQMFIIEKKRK